jgi:predicted DNA-binding protein (UPF0251 family)
LTCRQYEHMLLPVPPPLVPRRVCCQLTARGFRPIGRPPCKADAVSIGLDELEAVRLADIEGLYQDAAAQQMGISRQTYARILTRARAAVARCLIEQKMLLVESADTEEVVETHAAPLTCPVHGGRRRLGRTCRCAAGRPACGHACRTDGPSRSS